MLAPVIFMMEGAAVAEVERPTGGNRRVRRRPLPPPRWRRIPWLDRDPNDRAIEIPVVPPAPERPVPASPARLVGAIPTTPSPVVDVWFSPVAIPPVAVPDVDVVIERLLQQVQAQAAAHAAAHDEEETIEALLAVLPYLY